jgi:hypothetical protein
VTYPEYHYDTTVDFIATVVNEDLYFDTSHSIKVVSNISIAPSILNLIWSSYSHEENESYDLTIHASDPNSQDLTYEVTCDDSNVTIVQDGIDETLFHVTYPEYTQDTTVTYTITVTNEDLLSDIESDIKIVENIVLSGNRGIFGGGWYDAGHLDTIEYITISTPGNATDFGDLSQGRYGLAACSNGLYDRGVFGGGAVTAYVNTIDYVTISNPGNATNFGNLTLARNYLAACSDA